MINDLADEVEVSFEVIRVHDADNGVGKRGVVRRSEEYVGGNLFVGGSGYKAVSPRQVEQSHLRASAEPEAPFLSLDGHAGVVADPLPEAGQGVKQRRLAGIWIADQGNKPYG